MADTNLKLKEITNIFDYIDALCNLNIKDYLIMVAVKDTPGHEITKQLQQSFYNLGLKEYLIGKHQCGYIAVINNGFLVYEFLSEKFIGIKCNFEIDGYNLDIHSLPFTVGDKASIVIGTAQCAMDARGFNIVVFDKTEQVVVDSVSFDTHVPNYPITRKPLPAFNKNLFRYKVNMTLASQTELNTFSLINEINTQDDFKYWQLFRKGNETELDAKKRFFYGLECKDKELDLIHQGLSVLFYHFDKVCKESDIPYWMVGGSLIGAVRHGKCVPWDDDIDVYMLRKDVVRLENVISTSKDFEVKTYFNYETNYGYMRAVNFRYRGRDNPCFIDIFVMDMAENSSYDTWKKLTSLRSEIIAPSAALETKLKEDPKLNRMNEISALFDEFIEKEQSLLNPSRKGKSILWSVDLWQFWCKNVFDYEWIFPTRTVPFAYGTCEIPAKTEEMLEQWYGDIYTMPKDMLSHRHISLNKKQQDEINETIRLYAPKGTL